MFQGSAAAKKGLKKGDQILEVSLLLTFYTSVVFILHFVPYASGADNTIVFTSR